MVYFLLSKMEDMGGMLLFHLILASGIMVAHFVCFLPVDVERSNLYLKLFKLVFGSVSLFAQENEYMLKVVLVIVSLL